jgi:hypothetical protein
MGIPPSQEQESIMSHNGIPTKPPIKVDYGLRGANSTLAVEKGLAEADWYQCAVPHETMRKLLNRRDGPAIRDTILWFALILGSGFATYGFRAHELRGDTIDSGPSRGTASGGLE